ncbi:MAG: PucR family transcriptional regulator [Solirubrobacterales bacterium]|nr:PucR family transcriptional regulator [Solirubrobacterales bacterium]
MNVPDRPHLLALSSVRSNLVTGLRSILPEVGDEIIAAIRESVPEYARPLEGSFGRGVRAGVDEALTRFVDDIETPGADPGRWRTVYLELGRGEVRQGRTLDALLAAYRVGARVAWRRIAEAASAAGAGVEELTALAEAIFAYIDEISAISAEGYAAAHAEAAGEAQRRRELVVRLLIEGAGAEAVAQAVDAAGWRPPRSAAAVMTRDVQPGALATRLGSGVIAATLAEGVVCAVVPDADAPGRRSELASALAERPAAIGPTLELLAFGASEARARRTLELLEAGTISGSPALAADHLATLIVHDDPALLADHAARELAPLAGETELSRERLEATLRAWLDHPGRPTEVARAVHIHPQTARYRLRRLRDLLGEIDDPDRRFALALALRSRDR